MVIEDDPDVLKATLRSLRRLGYEVISGGDGSKTLDIVSKLDTPIDLIVSDVVLPNGNNGPDLADAITQQCGGVKVLLMTGYAAEEVLRLTNGDQKYPLLRKSFAYMIFAKLIELFNNSGVHVSSHYKTISPSKRLPDVKFPC